MTKQDQVRLHAGLAGSTTATVQHQGDSFSTISRSRVKTSAFLDNPKNMDRQMVWQYYFDQNQFGQVQSFGQYGLARMETSFDIERPARHLRYGT